MNNIEMIISEIVSEETQNLSIIEKFEKELSAFPYAAIAVKLNLNTYSALQTDEENIGEFPIADVKEYFRDSGIELKYSTIGLHLEGEKKRPHVHFNCIVLISPKIYQSITSNASQHRKRWLNKKIKNDEPIESSFSNLTFQFNQELDSGKAKYSTLAYPLKEGHHAFDRKMFYTGITKPIFDILLELGTTIYNKELGLHIRQEKCEERKKNALLELQQICEAGKEHFHSLREMVIWLDHNYIDTLDVSAYPDPKNYKTNCQKIAVHLKIAKYSDFI